MIYSAKTLEDFPDLMDCNSIALDTETDDKGLQQGLGSGWFNNNGEVLGVSLAYVKDNQLHKYYFPIAHASGNLDKSLVVSFLTNLFVNYKGTLVMHNAVYDLGWLSTLHIIPNTSMHLVDTGYAAALLDENRLSYRLDDLAKEELGVGKDYSLFDTAAKMLGVKTHKQVMTRLKDLPASYVAPYAAQDAAVTFKLYQRFYPQLKEQNLLPLFGLECRQIPMLLAMRKRGVRIDLDRVHELIDDFKGREANVQAELDEMAGEPFPNTRTAKQTEIIARLVGEDKLQKSEKGNYLTGKKATKGIKHPLFDKINELNHIRKLRKDFLENFLKFVAEDGRIHCEFNPLKTNAEGENKLISTKTGRYSSSCIAEGTMISMPAGDRPIEDVKVGDLVYCYTEDGKLEIKPVTATRYMGAKECIKLHWKGTGNQHTGELICTPDHRLKTLKRGWVEAQDLQRYEQVYHVHKQYSSSTKRIRLWATGLADNTEEGVIKTCYFKADSKMHIHHKDGNKCNNAIENLQVMTAQEHTSMHSKKMHAEGKMKWKHLHLPENRAPIKRGAEHPLWAKLSEEDLTQMLIDCKGRVKHLPIDYYTFTNHCKHVGLDWKAISIKYNRKYLAETLSVERVDAAFRKHSGKITLAAEELGVGYTTLRLFCRRTGYCYNHKIMSIEPVGIHRVYDLTVADNENFIANELCVHNCPNLTNIPASGELGHLIRTCFIPDEGCDWFCADYGQQEYRWAAHIAIKNKVTGWETVKRMYDENPDLDFHNLGSMLLFGNVDHDNRKKVKTLGFGILYGQGLDGFAQSLGCSKEEAQQLLQQYREKVPFVTAAMDMAKRRAEVRGYVTTKLGRRRRYDFFEIRDRSEPTIVKGKAAATAKALTPGDPWFGKTPVRYKTYTAINSMCQGSSADQTKACAVLLFEKYDIVPQIIVHDEFDLSIPKGDKLMADRIINAMQTVMKLEVPVKAEGGIGPNWGEAKG